MSQRCGVEMRRDTTQSFCQDLTKYADPLACHPRLVIEVCCRMVEIPSQAPC